MKINPYLRRLTIMVAVTLFGVWAAPSPPATASVGYDAFARGKRQTFYETDNISSGERTGTFNPSSQLLAAGTRDAMRIAWEGRYGVGSSPYGTLGTDGQPVGTLKRWTRAPNNELRFVVENALAWWHSTGRPLGGSCSLPCSGVPSEQEITDAQATGDAAIWEAWWATQPGFTEALPQHVSRVDKPYGPFTEFVTFWSRNMFFFNDLGTPPPPPPPVTCDSCCPACPPPPAPAPSCGPVPPFVRKTIDKGNRLTSKRAWTAVQAWFATCPVS